ncbi:non-hydrolyzing UDP-N-acetylglucosamine 2-epimerase [Saccharicrinis sp. FJH2]|uniref:non-hydrolyzing UDP-N-acetylglucosamine 2-epimerase n=1 Tax=Saccharicrinis sp. FJH65 TaxID=3344659 RepID=UPI0035F21F02
MSKKIITVVGARPQFVKAAAVSRAIRQTDMSEVIIHTGQHFDQNMSEVFFEEMEIPHPDYNLGISSLTHGAMTGRMLEGIEEILLKEKPDALMVYGDTNSTIAGALAAKKLGIKVAHVEAGLRSFNMAMPEEVNRILTDRISDLLFCPTDTAVNNLSEEGFSNFGSKIIRTGDVMYDAALFYSAKASEKSHILDNLALNGKTYLLATIHRQENTDNEQRLASIVEALNALTEITEVIVPLHPRTKKIMAQRHLDYKFKVIEPVGYFDMLELIKNSEIILTDSGGLQKEAFFFRKYCVTMRDETEWVELVRNGYNCLSGADTARILSSAKEMMQKEQKFTHQLYGNGDASQQIAAEILKL